MMRILHLVLEPRLSGAEVFAKDLAIEQRLAGSEVYIVSLLPEHADFAPLRELLQEHDVPCHFPETRSSRLGKLWFLTKAIRRARADVVFAHATIPAFYARALPIGVPIVYVMHSAVNDFERPLFRWVERILSVRARAVIGVSPANVADYTAAIRRHPHMSVIPNGVDTERFAQGDDANCAGERQIVQVGRYTSVKNQLQTVHAFNALAAQARDVRLVLHGVIEDEAYHAAVLDLVEKLGLAGRVVVGGPRSDVRELLHASSVFAMPSQSEGHSIAFLEALASGIPVVASQITPFAFARTLPAVQLVDTDDTRIYAEALRRGLNQHRVQRSLQGLTLQDTAQRYLAVARQVTSPRGMLSR